MMKGKPTLGNLINNNSSQHKHATTGGDSTLSIEQQYVLDLVLNKRQSVFFTGSAGVGKSFLLRKIIQELPPISTFITATTGIAADNIGGQTLHSFAGVGFGDEPIEKLIGRVRGQKSKMEAWKMCEVLIIDEISMLKGSFFDKLEEIARRVRNNTRPFGGIQLVLCGDFFQLPPVIKRGETEDFCFDAKSWSRCVQNCIELTKVFRQSDQEFVNLLNEVRRGKCSDATIKKLKECMRPLPPNDSGIVPTKLFPFNTNVDDENLKYLNALPGKTYTFKSFDNEPKKHKGILNGCRAQAELTLKVGAQVMLLRNMDQENSLVNGSRGVIKSFFEVPNAQEYIRENAKELARASNEPGIQNILTSWLACNRALLGTSLVLPVVQFQNGISRVILPHSFEVSVGEQTGYRCQLPLKLAWALTIHKCQGMTLDLVEMSLGNVFEAGQTYVALSRVRSLEGLQLRSFNAKAIRANDRVIKFYEGLKTITVNKSTSSTTTTTTITTTTTTTAKTTTPAPNATATPAPAPTKPIRLPPLPLVSISNTSIKANKNATSLKTATPDEATSSSQSKSNNKAAAAAAAASNAAPAEIIEAAAAATTTTISSTSIKKRVRPEEFDEAIVKEENNETNNDDDDGVSSNDQDNNNASALKRTRPESKATTTTSTATLLASQTNNNNNNNANNSSGIVITKRTVTNTTTATAAPAPPTAVAAAAALSSPFPSSVTPIKKFGVLPKLPPSSSSGGGDGGSKKTAKQAAQSTTLYAFFKPQAKK